MNLSLNRGYGDGSRRAVADGRIAIRQFQLMRRMAAFPIRQVKHSLAGVVVVTGEPYAPHEFIECPLAGIRIKLVVDLHLVHTIRVHRRMAASTGQRDIRVTDIGMRRIVMADGIRTARDNHAHRACSGHQAQWNQSTCTTPLESQHNDNQTHHHAYCGNPYGAHAHDATDVHVIFPNHRHNGSERNEGQSQYAQHHNRAGRLAAGGGTRRRSRDRIGHCILARRDAIYRHRRRAACGIIRPLPRLRNRL